MVLIAGFSVPTTAWGSRGRRWPNTFLRYKRILADLLRPFRESPFPSLRQSWDKTLRGPRQPTQSQMRAQPCLLAILPGALIPSDPRASVPQSGMNVDPCFRGDEAMRKEGGFTTRREGSILGRGANPARTATNWLKARGTPQGPPAAADQRAKKPPCCRTTINKAWRPAAPSRRALMHARRGVSTAARGARVPGAGYAVLRWAEP